MSWKPSVRLEEWVINVVVEVRGDELKEFSCPRQPLNVVSVSISVEHWHDWSDRKVT